MERERKRKLADARRRKRKEEQEERERVAAAARAALLAERQAQEVASLLASAQLQARNAQSLGVNEIVSTAEDADAMRQFALAQAMIRAREEEEREILELLAA